TWRASTTAPSEPWCERASVRRSESLWVQVEHPRQQLCSKGLEADAEVAFTGMLKVRDPQRNRRPRRDRLHRRGAGEAVPAVGRFTGLPIVRTLRTRFSANRARGLLPLMMRWRNAFA